MPQFLALGGIGDTFCRPRVQSHYGPCHAKGACQQPATQHCSLWQLSSCQGVDISAYTAPRAPEAPLTAGGTSPGQTSPPHSFVRPATLKAKIVATLPFQHYTIWSTCFLCLGLAFLLQAAFVDIFIFLPSDDSTLSVFYPTIQSLLSASPVFATPTSSTTNIEPIQPYRQPALCISDNTLPSTCIPLIRVPLG